MAGAPADSPPAPSDAPRQDARLGARDWIRIIAGGRIASVLAAGTPLAAGAGVTRFALRHVKVFEALSVHTPLPEFVAELNQFRPAILASYATVARVLIGEQEAGRQVTVECADDPSEQSSTSLSLLRDAHRNQSVVSPNLGLSALVIGALVVGAVARAFAPPIAVLGHEISEFVVIGSGIRMLRS